MAPFCSPGSGKRVMVKVRRKSLVPFFLCAQGVHLALDRRRAHEGGLRGLDPLVGPHHSDDALDCGLPLDAPNRA